MWMCGCLWINMFCYYLSYLLQGSQDWPQYVSLNLLWHATCEKCWAWRERKQKARWEGKMSSDQTPCLTPPQKKNYHMSHENQWLEDAFPYWNSSSLGDMLSFGRVFFLLWIIPLSRDCGGFFHVHSFIGTYRNDGAAWQIGIIRDHPLQLGTANVTSRHRIYKHLLLLMAEIRLTSWGW